MEGQVTMRCCAAGLCTAVPCCSRTPE